MSESEEVKYKRHLRNYLLNTGLQLRYTAFIVLISGTLTSALGYFVISKAHEATRVVEVRAMDPTDTIAQDIAAQFAKNDQALLIGLIIFGILLVIVLAGYGIVMTHKVAGPLFKIANYLDQIRDGKLSPIHNLRKGDQLADFFEHFKAAHDSLRAREQADVELLERISKSIGDASLKAEVEKIVDEKKATLA